MFDREKVATLVALAISAVWIGASIRALVTGDIGVLSAVTGVAMIAAGFLLGFGRRNGKAKE